MAPRWPIWEKITNIKLFVIVPNHPARFEICLSFSKIFLYRSCQMCTWRTLPSVMATSPTTSPSYIYQMLEMRTPADISVSSPMSTAQRIPEGLLSMYMVSEKTWSGHEQVKNSLILLTRLIPKYNDIVETRSVKNFNIGKSTVLLFFVSRMYTWMLSFVHLFC